MPNEKKDYVSQLLKADSEIQKLLADARDLNAMLEQQKGLKAEAVKHLSTTVGRQEHEKVKAYVRGDRVVVITWQPNGAPSVSIVESGEE